MLYYFLYPLANEYTVFNVFRYISFRSLGAAATALLICLVFGPWFIRRLKQMQLGQVVREEGPATHQKKSGTPTMGGALILFAISISTVLWTNITNLSVWIVFGVTIAFGLIGWYDDFRKIVYNDTKGLPGRFKLLFQFIAAGVATWLLLKYTPVTSNLTVPFLKDLQIPLGAFYVPFAMLVIVGSSNAVNLTDGLDGLAIGPVITTCVTFMILTYLAGHIVFAKYLNIPYVAGAGELSVFCAAVAASGLGFLWFNAHPAQVFMGDVGSLALGGTVGTLAVVTKNEILLLIVGGVFVAETLSVIIQVASFRLTGKRVFRMAPIHHHFELKGWAENKVIVRFWIVSILLAIIALSTIKLR